MVRLRSFLWLSALLVLVGGQSVARAPTTGWLSGPALRHGSADLVPESFVRAVADWRTALDTRARRDGPPLAHPGLLPAGSTAPRPHFGRLAGLPLATIDVPSAPDGPYPIFTTGPPSHA